MRASVVVSGLSILDCPKTSSSSFQSSLTASPRSSVHLNRACARALGTSALQAPPVLGVESVAETSSLTPALMLVHANGSMTAEINNSSRMSAGICLVTLQSASEIVSRCL